VEKLRQVLNGELVFFAKKILKKITRLTKNPNALQTRSRYQITDVIQQTHFMKKAWSF
jgi:hypothetical protein